ncbi:MAG TPA: hypothetical protein VK327_00090, partial [Candidatus Paceibacterota bacterium]|nr:hypothetical protein [Candidatus Paceibacterota bacterium]
SDDPSTPKKFRIPANTIIAPSGYVWFTETDFNPTPGTNNSFVLNSVGDDVYLFSADESGQLTGYSHGFEFGAVFNGVSIGRYVNSAGEESFPLLTSLSFGAANGDPRVGPIVISEIQFHPAMNGDEFVELMNIGGSEVPLFDPAHPTNTWKVPALGFTFPTNITLGAQQILLLVATNPASFRAKYGISNTVQILGPYSGALDNNGENLELQAPDSPDPGLVPYVTVEAIRYNDKSPWPAGASGTGSSLQRVVTYAYGDEPANWIAAAPTPGTVIANSDTDGDGLPDAWEAVNGTQVNVPDAGNDPDGDGFTNWQEYLAGTNPVDAGSLLKISGVTATASGAVLEFLAASNHTYSVLQSTNLNAAMWSKLTDIPAQPASRWMRVTNSANGSATRFYRLTTPAQL